MHHTDLERSLYFDAGYYQGQIDQTIDDPAAHFRREGDAKRLCPSPYFDTAFYKSLYPDWAAGGAQTALDDFLDHASRRIWRRPHPLIDPHIYLARYPDVAAAGIAPVEHFIRHGDAEGRSPSDAFDAGFYRLRYMALGDKMAFHHYACLGRVRGHAPAPVPRSTVQSAAAMAAALAPFERPIVLCVHDAQQAGAPLMTRDMALWCRSAGFEPVFVILRGGPVAPEFEDIGPAFFLVDGWDAPGLFGAVPRHAPVIVHSAAAVALAECAADAGLACVLLIHEMRTYLSANALLPCLSRAQAAGARLAVSFPRMADDLRAELGDLPALRPAVVLPPAPLASFRARRRAFAGTPMFIGAGHAESRKGFDLFIAACHGISARLPDATFVWLGALDAWSQDLADQALDRGLRLTLPGFVEDSLAWYAAAQVYLLTSRDDPGPSTVVHAAATGTPFVGYAANIGLKGVIDPLGAFVPVDQAEDFVRSAIDFACQDTPYKRHVRRRLLRPHLGFGAYGARILSLAEGACDPPSGASIAAIPED